MLAGLVGRAAWVRPLVRDGLLVDPVEELADVLPPQSLDRPAPAPLLPLPEGREILVARPARQGLGAQVALRRCPECRRHLVRPRRCWSDSRADRGADPRDCSSVPKSGIERGRSRRPRNPSEGRSERGNFAARGDCHVHAVSSDRRASDCLTPSPSIMKISGCSATTTFETTMINAHVLSRHGRGVRSSANLLARRPGERSTETAYHPGGAVTIEQPRAGELGR